MGVYDDLGVRTVINASGTLTRLGGSRMAPEVLAAMAEAATAFVDMAELNARAGEHIARLIGVEAAHVTSGSAGALLLAAAAATVWWTVANRAVAGTPTGTEVPRGMPTASAWEPEILEPCSAVDISRERADGTERCQRTRGADTPQNWVAAPPGGFPPKSDPGGPFTFEPCDTKGDFAYSPVGDHLYCGGTAWTLVH